MYMCTVSNTYRIGKVRIDTAAGRIVPALVYKEATKWLYRHKSHIGDNIPCPVWASHWVHSAHRWYRPASCWCGPLRPLGRAPLAGRRTFHPGSGCRGRRWARSATTWTQSGSSGSSTHSATLWNTNMSFLIQVEKKDTLDIAAYWRHEM